MKYFCCVFFLRVAPWSREHAGECPARRVEWLWLVKRTGPGVKEVSELPDPNPRVKGLGNWIISRTLSQPHPPTGLLRREAVKARTVLRMQSPQFQQYHGLYGPVESECRNNSPRSLPLFFLCVSAVLCLGWF